jgi:hypothetical protein
MIVSATCHDEPMFPLDDEGRPDAIWVCGICGLEVTWSEI